MKMNLFNTNAHDFRSQRKCISMTGCLIFVLFMSHASCRPSDADDVPLYNDGDYTDADDIEWQNFPVVETTTKDHPIIYYKEDIVSEDYDPNKENKSSSTEHETEIKPLPRRKYKNAAARRNRLNHTETYRYIKPEKVYFDVYPIEDEGIQEDETKFNDNDIDVEVISLLDDNNLNSNSEPELKHPLRKKSRKLSRRHRQRREAVDIKPDSDDESTTHAIRHKRYTYYKKTFPYYRGVFHTKVVIYPVQTAGGRPPIRGIYINPVSPTARPRPPIGDPIEFVPRVDINSTTRKPVPIDQPPVWTSYDVTTQRTTTRRPTRRPAPPIIHSGDEDYVPQESNIPSPQRTTTIRPPSFVISGSAVARAEQDQRFPIYTRRPPTVASWSRPRNTNSQRPRPTTTTTPPPPPPQESRGVSACIWAISACCTRTANIRYQCFERLGCDGAFWDFNPCADDIYRRAIEAGNQFLD